MTALFACFPVCLTFVALGVLGLLVLATGMYSRDLAQPEPAGPESGGPPDVGESRRPPLWMILLIFAVVLIHFVVALWLWPEL